MSDAKEPHPDETPITSKIIADADACPETRVIFLIKHLANQCKAFERQIALSPLAAPHSDIYNPAVALRAEWLADKIPAYGDYAKEAAFLLRQFAAAARLSHIGASIKIPTNTMEQEFQSHYRRGFEAGKATLSAIEPRKP